MHQINNFLFQNKILEKEYIRKLQQDLSKDIQNLFFEFFEEKTFRTIEKEFLNIKKVEFKRIYILIRIIYANKANNSFI